ncbi:putative DNA helicase INO80 [Debaryomyces fabryi]|uniref:Chromatin-remodeling ATPase INO80 n=1 Tax=Debaryomyces fabryi TaxID=58627 RepID=A0A0V1PVM4_9ASCO|nr:putative DNA helicase INO80 [Debaryomyces fabryi]KSA00226.1 putative DNA helicase INO80 [Debaryomyces fabryi]CUM54618.1 unnamed protein product [Debaryomyces fabryi]
MNISSMLSNDSTTPSLDADRNFTGSQTNKDLGGTQDTINKEIDTGEVEDHANGNADVGGNGIGNHRSTTNGNNKVTDDLVRNVNIVESIIPKPIRPSRSSIESDEEDVGKNYNSIISDDLDHISQRYLEKFEEKVNAINKIDQVLISGNNMKVLNQEEENLNTLMKKSSEIAENYIDRVVTEDISSKANVLNGKESIGKEFKWGSTRDTKKRELELEVENASKADTAAKKGGNKSKQGTAKSTPAKKTKAKPKRKQLATDETAEESQLGKKRKTRAGSVSGAAQNDDKLANGKVKLKLTLKDQAEEDSANPDTASKITTKEQKIITKQYDNTFVSIWKDLSRKDGPKVSRLMQQSTQAKMINLKKTSILAAREAKRWQLKNNRNQKDLTTKARRAMREMFNFWKRNERIERELRKKHEKELLDKAKKEEEERESKRQSRKLNFLITQTELYSHFIGKKIKTDEFEGNDSDPNVNFKSSSHHYDKYSNIDGESKDFNSIDFDNEDEESLNKAAAVNAQIALEAAKTKAQAFDNDPLKNPDTNGEEMNFQNPTLLGDINISQPDLLKCTLKEYQVKGLNWLANLYEQGINGILADEMGLGKTVQSISVLAYLAETHNIWGPFLVVTPASTLHNWQQEISRFVPEFKVIPYWGNAKDRKVLRKFWDRKNFRYGKDAPFHVLVTSYQLVVADAAYFQKMKWQYMILDEAQAIKSSQSSRWKSLLSFSCRNRLLLTGTPIQNSMQELWALLHFIMPSLFDSHDEFSDWFSKDIESHAQSNTELNEQQLRRLHVILKPFMLRRIKKNVQSELGDKLEIDVFCDLTHRQKKYYQMLTSQISIMDLLDSANNSSDDSAQSLMNLVMQFRKVCNHPDLFERADVKSSFAFSRFAETSSFLRETNELEMFYSTENLIKYNIPRMVYEEILQPTFDNDVGSRKKILNNMFNIYDPSNVANDELENFSWLKFVDKSPQEVNNLSKQNIIERAINNREYSDINYERINRLKYVYDEDDECFIPNSKLLLINELQNNHALISNSTHLKELYSIKNKVYNDMVINNMKPAAEPLVKAPPVDVVCNSISFVHNLQASLFDSNIRQSLMPLSFNQELELLKSNSPITEYPKSNMLPNTINKFIDYSNIRMPSMNRFITESGKLSKLDELLVDLKHNDHRVLIYFQMTKMMDLMEEYLTYRQHKYIRLDGSSKLDDRRDLVHDWQTKPEIFVFLLSTRAGGLGINLTAADTVIFYDSDWNPTIDSQAMDRAHRLGQTRQVTVYRLLTRGTIEERMRDRAKQKEQVQQVVMEGKSAIANKEESGNKKKDVAFLLLGDEESSAAVALNDDSEGKQDLLDSKKSQTKNLEDMYHEGEGEFSGNVTPAL